jgi:uncharacterized protein YdhG (YjbR/CyaY superfamily)
MAKRSFNSVDEYIASQPPAARPVLRRIRSTIRKAVPAAEEVIAYEIPTYKLQGRSMLHFAGWAHHYSLYPVNDRVIAEFKDELAPYEIKNHTLRFPLSGPVPVKLIERIAKFRATEVTQAF